FGLRQPVIYLVDRRLIGTETYYREIDRPLANPSPDDAVGRLRIFLGGQPFDEVLLYAKPSP
ncbi:MAG: hypothetical protein H5T66_13620, partial [Chloroflexi bacterium]|nr:hypothetical protein [Chloroflexota bacterium]